MNNPKNKHKVYVDEFSGIEASAPSKLMAWGLIRNECHRRRIQIPLLDEIKLKIKQ